MKLQICFFLTKRCHQLNRFSKLPIRQTTSFEKTEGFQSLRMSPQFNFTCEAAWLCILVLKRLVPEIFGPWFST